MVLTRRKTFGILGVLLVVIIAVVVVLVARGGNDNGGTGTGNPDEARQVTDKVWPATLALNIRGNVALADQPADLAVLGGRLYLLDSVRGRVIRMNMDGSDPVVLDRATDPQLALSTPMAIAGYKDQLLYVADSDGGRVLIVTPEGKVNRVISLAKASTADALPPRPLGLAAFNDASFVISDSNNHRLIRYSQDGSVIWSVGSGVPATGPTGLNNPVGVGLDRQGNVYVADMFNEQIKKFSQDGTPLVAFGEAGDSAGEFSRIKCVAVDDSGYIYVSDALQTAVQVFDPAGNFVGFIGRKDLKDPQSDSLFVAPHGVKLSGRQLFVVDRFAGVFIFDLGAVPPPTTSTSGTETTTTAGSKEP
jgi:hypothetical protein